MNFLYDFSFFVPKYYNGFRLDSCIFYNIELCSRAKAISLIKQGYVSVDGFKKKPSYKVKRGEFVLCLGESDNLFSTSLPSKDLSLEIIYEDLDLVIINKQSGIVVHPSLKHTCHTLLDMILDRYSYLKEKFFGSDRPGIIHRLDKNTTGLIVIAKNLKSLNNLLLQFKKRSIKKKYIAIVHGVPFKNQGIISYPLGRSLTHRKTMSICSKKARQAITTWKVLKKFGKFASLLEINIKTGRTHQIRVHCKIIGHEIIGDPIYGKKNFKLKFKNNNLKVKRQMLHANELYFKHPISNKNIGFKVGMPYDMTILIRKLEEL